MCKLTKIFSFILPKFKLEENEDFVIPLPETHNQSDTVINEQPEPLSGNDAEKPDDQPEPPEDKPEPLIIKKMKLVSANECLKKYGWGYDLLSTPDINEQLVFERNHMTLYVVPEKYKTEGALPNRIYCNKDLVIPIGNAFENIYQADLLKEILSWDGCYNPRPIRGYEARFKELINQGKYEAAVLLLSIHSWGIAIDINAAWNKLGQTPTLSKELVACFKLAGFNWGGDFSRRDGMHYELSAEMIS